MSRFDNVKEKVSDVAENVKAHAEALIERGESEYQEFKAKQAEKRAADLDKDPDRRDKIKPTAA